MAGSVAFTQDGRDGSVRYREGGREIAGYWAFGGDDVVTIISMGSRDEWRVSHASAIDRRGDILRRVADEAIRQRAPSCLAEIDEESGVILLRQRPGATAPVDALPSARRTEAAAFVRRFTELKAMIAMLVLAVALIGAAALWLGQKAVTRPPARGAPLNDAARYGVHGTLGAGGLAALLQTADPGPPRWSGRGGGETFSVSLVLIPFDGSTPRRVAVARGLSAGALSLARILGDDGRTLWVDAAGLYGVRLSDKALIAPKDLARANPALDPSWWDDPRGMDIVDGRLHAIRADRSGAVDVDPATLVATPTTPKPSKTRFDRPAPADHLAAGFVAAPGLWLGLHATEDVEGALRPGSSIRPVEDAEDAKAKRRLYLGVLEDGVRAGTFRIRSLTPVGDTEYLAAAFLRMDRGAEPLRLPAPDSALMVHTAAPGIGGALVVSRVTAEGAILWSTNTGLDRFAVTQIFPGTDVTAFIGARPPTPGVLSEPLAVFVNSETGTLTSHSLTR